MAKYIDADLLYKEIEKKITEREKELKSFSDEDYVCSVASHIVCRKRGYLDIIELLDSLQQERPDCHTVEEWMQHIKNSDQLTKDIFSKGPYDVLYDALNHPYQHCYNAIKEFGELCFQTGVNSVKQEQPEVDLEKFTEKMDAWKARFSHPDDIPIKATMAFTARMFYMYPNTAREWYESLPKATMDNARNEE